MGHMQLSQSIKASYFQHLTDLSVQKQFHFCTRIAAWEGNQVALDHLATLRPHFVPEPYNEETMGAELMKIIIAPPAVTANAQNLRQTYFDKYPALRGLDNALFRVRHLLSVYGIDARGALLQTIPRDVLLNVKTTLLSDDEALRTLSTYAINYIYLLERIVLQHTDAYSIDLDHLYQLGKNHELTDPQQLQLYLYLYTHCVIGETNFYTRHVPEELLSTYRYMVAALESVIEANFANINLDNKLEFLVCCQIVGLPSKLAARIYQECDQSLSDEGNFLIDKLNNNAQADRSSLAGSEHRNVLYIMSQTGYNPHSTLVAPPADTSEPPIVPV